MQKVLGGCKLCWKRMLTHLSPLFNEPAMPARQSNTARPIASLPPDARRNATLPRQR